MLASYGRDRDHLDGLPDLQAAGGRVEGDHERHQRDERPWADQPERRALGVAEIFDRHVGDPEQHAGRCREEQRFAARLDAGTG